MPVEYIQLTRLQKLEIMENQELTTMRRQSRKKKHMAKSRNNKKQYAYITYIYICLYIYTQK